MNKNTYTIVLFLLVISNSIFSQTIVTDRPDQTESASTIEKGSLQIESGILIGFSDKDSFSEHQILAPTTLFRYGIKKGIELRVLNQLESLKNEATNKKVTGISDLELGTKIQLFKKENVNTEIAVLSHLIIPTGSKDLTINKFGSINKLSISHDFNENVALGYNVGYNYFGKGNGDFTYSMSLGFDITDKLGIYVEPYGEIINFKNHEANFDAGIAYLLKDNLQFDFSFGTGINHTMNYMSIGCSINIEKKNG
tara:strand:- start:269 stop:1030 length:762 start_codon:yes stop_codon:yes gene_type:complete